MASFLERDQLVPAQPYISDTQGTLQLFKTAEDLYGTGAAQLAGAERKYMSLKLLHPDDQKELNGLMEGADTTLKKVATTNLGVYNNVKDGISAFDPIVKNQYIMGDNAYTMLTDKELEKSEVDRTKDGGKNYNRAAVDYISAGRQLFSSSPRDLITADGAKIPTWKLFQGDPGQYISGGDNTEEIKKLSEMFKTDVVKKDSTEGTPGYIVGNKDSSWYKGKWQAFVEANASPALKAQLQLEGKAEYRKMLLMYRDQPEKIQQYYAQQYERIKDSKRVELDQKLNEATLKMGSLTGNEPDYIRLKAGYQSTIDAIQGNKKVGLEGMISQLSKDNPIDAGIADITKLQVNEQIAGSIHTHDYFDKIGSSYAHADIEQTTKMDGAYWANKNLEMKMTELKEDARQFNTETKFKYDELGINTKLKEKELAQNWDIAQLNRETELIKAGLKADGKLLSGSSEFDYTGDTAKSGETDKEKDGENVVDRVNTLATEGYSTIYGKIQGEYFGSQSFIDNMAASGNKSLSQIRTEGGTGEELTKKVANWIADAYWGTALYDRVRKEGNIHAPADDVAGSKAQMTEYLLKRPAADSKRLLNMMMSSPQIESIMLNSVGDKEKGIKVATEIKKAKKELEGTLKGFDESFGPIIAETLKKQGFPSYISPDSELGRQGVKGYEQIAHSFSVPTDEQIRLWGKVAGLSSLPKGIDEEAGKAFEKIKAGESVNTVGSNMFNKTSSIDSRRNADLRRLISESKTKQEFVDKYKSLYSDRWGNRDIVGETKKAIYKAIGENGGMGFNEKRNTTYLGSEKIRAMEVPKLLSYIARQSDNTPEATELAALVQQHPDVVSEYTIGATGIDGKPKIYIGFDSDKLKAIGWTLDDVKKYNGVGIKTDAETIPLRFRSQNIEFLNLGRSPKSIDVDYDFKDKVAIPVEKKTIRIENTEKYDNPKFKLTGSMYMPNVDAEGNFVYKEGKLDLIHVAPREFTELINKGANGNLQQLLKVNPGAAYKFATNQAYYNEALIKEIIRRDAKKVSDIPTTVMDELKSIVNSTEE